MRIGDVTTKSNTFSCKIVLKPNNGHKDDDTSVLVTKKLLVFAYHAIKYRDNCLLSSRDSDCKCVAVARANSCNGQNETLRRFIIIFYPTCFVYEIIPSFVVVSKGLDENETKPNERKKKKKTHTHKNYELCERASLCTRTT